MNKRDVIVLGSDRRGFCYKKKLIAHLMSLGCEVIDVGPYDDLKPYDYPVFGELVARTVASGKAKFGVVICGTGIGISIVANKIDGIRCGMAYTDEVAEWMRRHNNANIIAFGEDYMEYTDVERRLDIFIKTPFDGDYHLTRIKQILDIEQGKPIKQNEIINKEWNSK